ncbi:MAG: SsrA-binding protein SmpB [Chitinophagales bacterium]|nr:SsrA-binding protein SmpB [Chitinophagales bacterium]MDW8393718.1 SsrA-binding protein SmpB [Chitinophagales bacterium]
MMKPDVEIRNRKAGFEYELLDRYTAGMVLTGTEIKSIRQGKVAFNDAWCYFSHGALWVKNLNIAPYPNAGRFNHEPLRPRKLLLKSRELAKLQSRIKEKGLTLVPVRLFIAPSGYAKLEIALARGKKLYDKRQTLLEREAKRRSRSAPES